MSRFKGCAAMLALLGSLIATTPMTPAFADSSQTSMAPVFTLQGLNEAVSLEEYRGRVVYLDFWASWCAPCLRSFPWMNELQTRFEDKGLTVIAINLDENSSDAEEFLEATRPNFVIAYDPEGSTAADYRVQGMPSSYLIARDGTLSWRHIGFRAKDKGNLEKRLIALLETPL